MGSSEVSPYTLQERLAELESVKALFIEYLEVTKSGEDSKGGKMLSEYEDALKRVSGNLSKEVEKYPDDEEFRKFFDDFSALYKKRGQLKIAEELEKLKELVGSLKHIIDWRIVGKSSGTDLPFKDFRSMRGGRGRR